MWSGPLERRRWALRRRGWTEEEAQRARNLGPQSAGPPTTTATSTVTAILPSIAPPTALPLPSPPSFPQAPFFCAETRAACCSAVCLVWPDQIGSRNSARIGGQPTSPVVGPPRRRAGAGRRCRLLRALAGACWRCGRWVAGRGAAGRSPVALAGVVGVTGAAGIALPLTSRDSP